MRENMKKIGRSLSRKLSYAPSRRSRLGQTPFDTSSADVVQPTEAIAPTTTASAPADSSNTIPAHPDILRNSIYITFNSPAVDEYHRSILITYQSTRDGTLIHAVWSDETKSWGCERREIKNLAKARSLTLMYCLGSMPAYFNTNGGIDPDLWFGEVEKVLLGVDTNPLAIRSDDLVTRLGNPKLGGYSCIVWSIDAVAALAEKGLISLRSSAERALMKARLIAGPEDGKSMAGKDHGPLRVINNSVPSPNFEWFAHHPLPHLSLTHYHSFGR